MPSTSSLLISAGYRFLARELGTTISFRGITKPCVASGIDRSLQLKNAGFEPVSVEPTVTMLGADFAEFNAQPEDILSIVVSDGVSVPLILKTIRRSAADPCVRLTLQLQP